MNFCGLHLFQVVFIKLDFLNQLFSPQIFDTPSCEPLQPPFSSVNYKPELQIWFS